jgi:hypothetical protein
MREKNNLWHAVNVGNKERVQEEYRKDQGALLTADYKLESALHIAMFKAIKYMGQYQEIVYFLLDVGHPIYIKNVLGRTPFDYDEPSLKKVIGPWLLAPKRKDKLSSQDFDCLYARLGNDPKLRAVIEKIEIDQVKSEQLVSLEAGRSNDQEQHHFRQKIYKLTIEDVFQRTLSSIAAEVTVLCQNRMSVDRFNALLKACHHPSLMLNRAALKATDSWWAFWRSGTQLTDATSTLKNLLTLIQKLFEECKLIPAYHTLGQLLLTLKDIYEQFCTKVSATMAQAYESVAERARQIDQVFQPPYLIYSLELRGRELLPEPASYLDIEVRDNERGMHTIRRFNHIHFKRHWLDPKTQKSNNPCDPSIESMVASLHNTVAGQAYGIAPTEIIKTQQLGEPPKIFIGSNNVGGINLDVLISNRPEYLNKCDEYSFAAIITTGLLTLPTDGKFENFIVQFINTMNSNDFVLRFVGIDNDKSFGNPIIADQKEKSSYCTEVIFVFFLFPLMEKIVDAKFKKQLLDRPAELIVLEWIKLLCKQNDHYFRLLSENILSKEEWASLFLPIRFIPGRLSFIYQQLCKLQDYLRDNQNCTYDELFVHLYPRLGADIYQMLRRKHQHAKNPVLSAFEELIRPPAKGRESEPKKESSLRTPILTTAQRYDYITSRSQSLVEAIEDCLTVMDFSRLEAGKNFDRVVLTELKELKIIRRLTVKNSSGLDVTALKNLLGSLPNLAVLNLINCTTLSAQDIIDAVLARPKAHDDQQICIGIRNCAQITKEDCDNLASQRQIKLILLGPEIDQAFRASSNFFETIPDNKQSAVRFATNHQAAGLNVNRSLS